MEGALGCHHPAGNGTEALDVHGDFMAGRSLLRVGIYPSAPLPYIWGVGDDMICPVPFPLRKEGCGIPFNYTDKVHVVGLGIGSGTMGQCGLEFHAGDSDIRELIPQDKGHDAATATNVQDVLAPKGVQASGQDDRVNGEPVAVDGLTDDKILAQEGVSCVSFQF